MKRLDIPGPSRALVTLTLLLSLVPAPCALAQVETEFEAPASPNRPWAGIPSDAPRAKSCNGEPAWRKALLWLPNRMLDLLDVVKADVGIGPSSGAVLRVTRYGQLGYRTMNPGSVRVGLLGRRFPITAETDNEFGIGPTFHTSRDRKVCKGELGLGLDLFLLGGYAGLCVDELADFAGGIFLFDFMGDDY